MYNFLIHSTSFHCQFTETLKTSPIHRDQDNWNISSCIMKQQRVSRFCYFTFAVGRRKRKTNSAKYLICFVLLKIYGSQSQVQKELTLNYNFMRRKEEGKSKYATVLLHWLVTGHLPFIKIKLHVH